MVERYLKGYMGGFDIVGYFLRFREKWLCICMVCMFDWYVVIWNIWEEYCRDKRELIMMINIYFMLKYWLLLLVFLIFLSILDVILCFDLVFGIVGYFFFRRLVEKLDNMYNNVIGDGRDICFLCGSKFGILKVVVKRCDICEKVYNKY